MEFRSGIQSLRIRRCDSAGLPKTTAECVGVDRRTTTSARKLYLELFDYNVWWRWKNVWCGVGRTMKTLNFGCQRSSLADRG